MTDLEQQLNDPEQRKEILEKLAKFAGWIQDSGGYWWQIGKLYSHVLVENPESVSDIFDPFADTSQGAWDCEQVESALSQKWAVEMELLTSTVTCKIRSYQDGLIHFGKTVEGPLAKRLAICACALKVMEGENGRNGKV